MFFRIDSVEVIGITQRQKLCGWIVKQNTLKVCSLNKRVVKDLPGSGQDCPCKLLSPRSVLCQLSSLIYTFCYWGFLLYIQFSVTDLLADCCLLLEGSKSFISFQEKEGQPFRYIPLFLCLRQSGNVSKTERWVHFEQTFWLKGFIN